MTTYPLLSLLTQVGSIQDGTTEQNIPIQKNNKKKQQKKYNCFHSNNIQCCSYIMEYLTACQLKTSTVTQISKNY